MCTVAKARNREIYIVLVIVIPALILSAVYLPWWAALAGAAPLVIILYALYRRNKSMVSGKKSVG